MYDWKEGRDEFIDAFKFVRDMEENKMSQKHKMSKGSVIITEDRRSFAFRERNGKKIEDRLYIMNSERKSRIQKS